MAQPNKSGTRRGARRHARPAVRRAQILEAALRCFSEKGYHQATMDDLARASGLSKGSLYWHFSSKQQVFLALFDVFAAEMFGLWDSEVASAEGRTLETLGRVGVILLERFTHEAPLYRAWAEFLAYREVQERFAAVYRSSRERLRAVIERGIAAGEIREVPVESVGASIVAAIEGLLLQAMVDPEFEAAAHWPVSWQVFTRGLER